MLVYLAGPIDGCTYEDATDWRDVARKHLAPDIEVLSPMRDKQWLNKGETPICNNDYPSHHTGGWSFVFTRDFNDIRRSDLVLINTGDESRASLGTAMELGYAYALGKPVVICCTYSGPWDMHPLVNGGSTILTYDLYDALEVVKLVLGKGV